MPFDAHIDLGGVVPGLMGATATGSTAATAALITYKVTIFTTVLPGSGCILPSSSSFRCELCIINRGANTLLVYPPNSSGSVIESLSPGAPYSIPAGSSAFFQCQDPETAPGRKWFALPVGFTSAPLFIGLPTSSAGLPAGSVWNNGGVLCVV